MKLRSLAFLAVSSIALAGFQTDDVTLTRTFQVGSKDVYVQSYKSKNSLETPAGNQDFNLNGSSTYTIVYKTNKGEGCEIDMITSDMKVESDNEMSAGMTDAMPKELTMSGLLDSRNRVTGITAGKGMDPMMAMAMSSATMGASGFFTEFPEKAIKIGDVWDVPVGLAGAGVPADTKLKAKLESENDNYWVVRVSGDVPMTLDMSEMAKGTGVEMVMNMKMTMDYGVRVEKSTGRTLQLSGKMATDIKMELPTMGMTIPGKGTSEISAILKK